MNWRAERLTTTVTSFCSSDAAKRVAPRSTPAPIGSISPLSSACEKNEAGATSPSLG